MQNQSTTPAIVKIVNNQPVTDSLCLAEGSGNEHASVILLVRNYIDDLKEFGLVDFKSTSTNGRPTEYAILNEPQATLLLTYMKNTERIRTFKKALVKAFFTMAEMLRSGVGLHPATLLPIDREFRAAVRMARAAGLDKNQAILSANRLTGRLTGSEPLKLLEITHLESDSQEKHLTASDIGKQIGMSGQAVNIILEEIGLQSSYRDHKNRKQWKVEDSGKPYAVLKDTGKAHSDGTPVLQTFWKESVLTLIQEVAA